MSEPKLTSDASPGVLLIGHGTRDQTGTSEFFQLADRLTTLISPVPVAPALLEFQEPTIAQAWQSLRRQGVDHVHVAPLLLFAAGHAKGDIPSAIEDCKRNDRQVGVQFSRPLSRHQAVVDLVLQRIHSTIATCAGGRPDRATTVGHPTEELSPLALFMVGRGSRDPCAQADMRVLSELVNRRLDVADTFTSFYAMAEPEFASLLERVAGSGRYRTIVVHPHLLFAGRLYQAIAQQTADVRRRFDQMQIVCGRYLGPTQSIAQAVADRTIGPVQRRSC